MTRNFIYPHTKRGLAPLASVFNDPRYGVGVYYLIGGLLAVLLAVYFAYYIVFLVTRVSAVSEKTLPNTSEVATFNLEKFSELKILR